MNIVKISQEVFETILNNNILPIDQEHLPYSKICIAFPYSFFRSADEMIEDSLKVFKKKVNEQGMGYKQALEQKKDEIEKVKRIITNYCNSDLHVIFEINQFKITVKHSKPSFIGINEQILFNGINIAPLLNSHEILPLVKINEMNSNEIWQYKTLLKLVSGVIYALNNQHVKVIESQEYNKPNNKQKTKKRHNNIRYITNIKYISDKTESEENKQKRIYNLEAWEVRGHWRHFQNGKRIWVSTYVKGDKEKLVQKDNIYKLNKIEIE